MRKKIVIFLLSTCLLVCNSLYSRNFSVSTDTSRLLCLQKAARQLDEALSIMQKHYYKKEAVQWDTLIRAAKARLSSAASCEEAYTTVNWCFSQMSEKHSFIMPPVKAAEYNYDTAYLPTRPSITKFVGEIKGELLADKGIAYLTLPWISTSNAALCTRIADSLQQLIARLDQQGISKWIIDLRKNTGGNCWPMLAGIGPLLGNGICGYFVSAMEKIPISYYNGAAMQGRNVRCRVSSNAYQTKSGKKHIVVLTGPRTSSAGEIVALAFKGKEQTYLYGEPTAGFTTANATYTMSDNSLLVLTVCQEADRNGKIYEGKIIPDEIISSQAINELDDPIKSAAIMWLHIQ